MIILDVQHFPDINPYTLSFLYIWYFFQHCPTKTPHKATIYFVAVCFREGVSVKIGKPAFWLALCLTGVHFPGELQHVGDVSEQKLKCRQSELEK